MNIAKLNPKRRNAIQRDKIAALWAHNVKTGHERESQIMRRIYSIKDEWKREDMIERFRTYMNT